MSEKCGTCNHSRASHRKFYSAFKFSFGSGDRPLYERCNTCLKFSFGSGDRPLYERCNTCRGNPWREKRNYHIHDFTTERIGLHEGARHSTEKLSGYGLRLQDGILRVEEIKAVAV